MIQLLARQRAVAKNRQACIEEKNFAKTFPLIYKNYLETE